MRTKAYKINILIINKQFCITKLFSSDKECIKSVQVCRILILADRGNPISKPQQIWHMITLKHNKDRFKVKHCNIRSPNAKFSKIRYDGEFP